MYLIEADKDSANAGQGLPEFGNVVTLYHIDHHQT